METFTEWSHGFRELSLFSGAGGGSLGTKYFLGWRTVGYVEWNDYCQRVIKARIADGLLDDAPLWDDVKTFDGTPWRGLVDVITAGFPCQPFSVAGKQQAADDLRNGWPDTIRIIREVQPAFCLLENVPGLLAESHGYFGTILKDLAQSGYDARWRVLSAAEVGAPHKRDRVWVVAVRNGHVPHPQSMGWGNGNATHERATNRAGNSLGDGGAVLADATSPRRRQPRRPSKAVLEPGKKQRSTGCSGSTRAQWPAEPAVGRVAHGVADRVDRIKALGNGQVPQVAATAWRLLTADLGE